MVIHRRHRRGFTLVESLVAAVMLGVSLAVLTGLVGRGLDAQRIGREVATAAHLADEQLAMAAAMGPEAYETDGAMEGMCAAPFESFRYKVELSRPGAREPYEVTCTITWQSGGVERSVRVATLLSRREGDEPDPERAPITPVERAL